MARITLRTPDAEPVTVELERDRAVLVGRDPDPGRLPPGNLPVQRVVIASQRISTNHLLISCRQEGTWVQDLQSRNGSFLRLLPGRPACVPGGASLTVELAGIAPGDPRLTGPQPVEWTGPAAYAGAVLAAARAWLGRLGSDADLDLSSASAGAETCLPLADGSRLRVSLPRGATHDVQWPQVLERLRAFVQEQNALFDQEQGWDHEEGLILASPAIRAAHRQVAEAAARGLRVMLLGPTGSGKEVLAACYHRHSRQAGGPFKAVNCSHLRRDFVYPTLFGARRGAYTGCVQDRSGAVECASGGTLFLDEVGDMDLEAQAALLRFLNGKGEYERLGDPETRHAANVQIVCATHVDLREAIQRGRFREDLWYRLAVKEVRVPPLRERREDILACLEQARVGPMTALEALSPEALELVLADPWPGNFRALKNFVERLPTVSRAHAIGLAACRAALDEGRGPPPAPDTVAEPAGGPETPGWPELLRRASAAFAEDHGGAPRNAGQLQIYVERYLKPVFVAHAAGCADLGADELARGTINYSRLARQLDILDGTTVKRHLQRYVERYRGKGRP